MTRTASSDEATTSRTRIGTRVRDLRKWLRISQTALAEYLEIPRTAVSALEAAKRDLGAQEVIKLSRLFRCDPNSLLGLAKTPVDYQLDESIKFNARSNSSSEPLEEHDLKELGSFKAFLEELFRDGTVPQRKDPRSLVKSKAPKIAANELREKLKVKGVPIDVYSAIENIGLYPRFTSLVGLAGAIVRVDFKNDHVFGILINSDQPEERTRFSACHELAHYCLEHLPQSAAFHSSPKARWKSATETDADTFAAEFLMAKNDIEAELGKSKVFTASGALKLADKFLVSYQAMVYRLRDLGLISHVQHEEFLGQKPSELRANLQLSTKRKAAKPFDSKIVKDLVDAKASSTTEEFRSSPDWIRLIQEAACFEYWKNTPFYERTTEVKEIYETTALWLAKH